jgi:hypothetical protein
MIARQAGIPSAYCLPPDHVRGGRKGADWNDALMELGEDAARLALEGACHWADTQSGDILAETDGPRVG